jgi:hypothetical protein
MLYHKPPGFAPLSVSIRRCNKDQKDQKDGKEKAGGLTPRRSPGAIVTLNSVESSEAR